MADLKHCAQMADSKCHHPIEFLFSEYANDRYTIQRDARSIGFFFLGRPSLNVLCHSWASVFYKTDSPYAVSNIFSELAHEIPFAI